MQKTGTTSIHKLFKDNKLNSVHDPWWWNEGEEYIKKYDCFTDGFENNQLKISFPDLKFIESKFENSKFILQTRNLRDWIISRIKHNKNIYLESINVDEYDERIFLHWVSLRNYWYTLVFKYFENKNNLLVIDINDPKFVEKVSEFTGIELKSELPKCNSINNNNTFDSYIDKFLDDFIEKDDHHSTGIVRIKSV